MLLVRFRHACYFLGKRLDVLISRLEHVVRTLDSTRTYSRHLTAASWKRRVDVHGLQLDFKGTIPG
jgi:hypothetical protein